MVRKVLKCCLIVLLPAFAVAQQKTEKPNFLFIAFDDLNDNVGYLSEQNSNFLKMVYPDPEIRKVIAQRITPNFNRLAKMGTAFTRSYCASPVCNPSRTALLTGVRPHKTGVYGNQQFFRSVAGSKDLVTLPQYLKQNGYYTAGLGKIFHQPVSDQKRDDADTTYSWSWWGNAKTGANGGGAKNSVYAPPVDPTDPASQPGLFNFKSISTPKEKTSDYMNASFIANVLKNGTAMITDFKNENRTLKLPVDQPFFLALGVFRPHLPWIAPQVNFERFPVEEMSLNEELLNRLLRDTEDLPISGKNFTDLKSSREFNVLLNYAEDKKIPGGKIAAWKAAVQAYFACINYADECLGKVLDAYEQSRYRNNTILVVWSDHGYHLGTKYHFGKVTMWEQANHSNLIILDPTVKQAKGVDCDKPVSLIDLYPTIVAMAKLQVPKLLDGVNIAPLLQTPNMPWDKFVISTWGEGNHNIRNADWRYIRYKNGDQELYHEMVDPNEQNNLANNPEYKKQLQLMDVEMNRMLGSYVAKTVKSDLDSGEGANKRNGQKDISAEELKYRRLERQKIKMNN